jgi:hypothetical protein
MWWLVIAVLLVVEIASGIRKEQRAGMWSWSKFAFALAFAGLEFAILVIPLTYIDPHSRYYTPIVVTACLVAALNFVWMIMVARRWKLPDGRTSLQAYRDEQEALRQNRKTKGR